MLFFLLYNFMYLNTVTVSLLSLIFQLNNLIFSSLPYISDFRAYSGPFLIVLYLSWHIVPKIITILQPTF